MGRRSRAAVADEPRRDLTPLIDVVFLLIVFFMVAAEFSNVEFEELTLPVADQARPDESAGVRQVTLNVRADGTLRCRGRLLSGAAGEPGLPLDDYLRAEAAGLPRGAGGRSPLVVTVRADAAADFGHVQEILDACCSNAIFATSLGASPEGE